MIPILISKTILDDKAIATSGNYRSFRAKNGHMINHIIDPTTGLQKETNIVSVSVKADECLTADAWATALMVLSYDVGIKKVEEDKTIDALWIILNEDSTFSQSSSRNFFR